MNNNFDKPNLPAKTSFACLISWLGTRGDFEGAERRAAQLTGWRRYTSTNRMEGKFVIGTASVIFWACLGGYLVYRHRRNKKLAAKEEKLK